MRRRHHESTKALLEPGAHAHVRVSSKPPTNIDSKHCRHCLLRIELCLCRKIIPVPCDVLVLIVRHHLETYRRSNTARVAAMAITSCRVLSYGKRGTPLDPTPLKAPGSWLVFPEGPFTKPPPLPPPQQLIVLDGSWPQARRMRQRIMALRGMPILSLAPPTSPPRRLRKPPLREGMATIEAIAHALSLCGDTRATQTLSAAHALLIERLRAAPPTAPAATDTAHHRAR